MHAVYGNVCILNRVVEWHQKFCSGWQGAVNETQPLQSPYGPQCPGHTELSALEGVGPSSIQPECVTMCLPYVQLLQESAEVLEISVRQGCQDCGGTVVPASTQGVCYGGDTLAGSLMECLPHHPRGLL